MCKFRTEIEEFKMIAQWRVTANRIPLCNATNSFVGVKPGQNLLPLGCCTCVVIGGSLKLPPILLVRDSNLNDRTM